MDVPLPNTLMYSDSGTPGISVARLISRAIAISGLIFVAATIAPRAPTSSWVVNTAYRSGISSLPCSKRTTSSKINTSARSSSALPPNLYLPSSITG